jgi:hypothetical protein
LRLIRASSDLKIIVAPIPAPPAAIRFLSLHIGPCLSKSKNQTEAWKFLYSILKRNSEKNIRKHNPHVWYSKVWTCKFALQDQNLGPVIRASENKLKSFPVISNTFDDGLNDEVIRFQQMQLMEAQGVYILNL